MKLQVVTKFGCDFCGKSQDDVASLIVGPKSVCICNECVAQCVQIVDAKAAETESNKESRDGH
jgi:ATP-dependent Clp protease ATP-binding subunit ClpX